MSENKIFYTNCLVGYETILYRGVENGKHITKRIPYKPSLFVPTKDDSKYLTLYGERVGKIQFDSVADARKFVKRYEGIENFKIYGNTRYNYCYLSDIFPGKINYDINDIVVFNIDIETGSENGFPHPEYANEEVVAISIKIKNNYYVFGCGKFDTRRSDVLYFHCQNEIHLLESFLKFWKKQYPDIITGWYINGFDIPYLINRITKILGTERVKSLSPWGTFSRRSVLLNGKEVESVSIDGIAHLDYIELYKKFAPEKNRESYSLDYISRVELGEKKIEYDGSLHQLYKTDYQKFIEYNIHDVHLVDRLDNKLQLISMAIDMAYDAKVNFSDAFAQVRMWDTLVFNELKKLNVAVPMTDDIEKQRYVGAYVKDPIIGLHKWVVSLDLNSLYPSIIQLLNISPETIVLNEPPMDFELDDLIDKSVQTEELRKPDYTLAANGQKFRKNIVGVFPKLLKRKYQERVQFKNRMLSAQQELERVKNECKKRGLVYE